MEGHVRHEHGGLSSADDIDVMFALKGSGIVPGNSVLDLGCGSGDYSIAASELVTPEGRIYALDKHESSLTDLMARLDDLGRGNIIVIKTDMTSFIPLDDAELDVILLFNVLHGLYHNKEEVPVLKEVSRILKPKGILSVMESIPGREGKGPPDSIRLSSERIEKILSPYGFAIERTLNVSDDRVLVLLRR